MKLGQALFSIGFLLGVLGCASVTIDGDKMQVVTNGQSAAVVCTIDAGQKQATCLYSHGGVISRNAVQGLGTAAAAAAKALVGLP